MGAQESNAVVQSVVHAVFQVPDIEHPTQVACGTQHPTIPVAQGFQTPCLITRGASHICKKLLVLQCFANMHIHIYICVCVCV